MAINYTASIWTTITSSATIPIFDPSTYTLKGVIDNRNHITPGNPYLYPSNISAGQNLYVVLTAPSGGVIIPRYCVRLEIESDSYLYNCPGNNPYVVKATLYSGSCGLGTPFPWSGSSPLYISYQARDNNNNYYYGDLFINNGATSDFSCVDVYQNGYLVSASAEFIQNLYTDREIIECRASNCFEPNEVIFNEPYVVVSPSSITSSTFPAQILNISGGNYGVKVSSSVDGQLANVDIGIGWVSSSNTPRYYTGSFGGVYYSNQISASVQRNNCPSGEAGSYVLYTLPVSYSSATSSQVDAQTTAQAYFNSTSQSYANTYGTCSPTGSTMSIYAKYVSLAAELEYNVNNTSWVSLGTINTSTCTFVTTVTALTPGDSVEFRCVGSEVLSVSTTTCPASATQCADYQFLAGGANTFYITVNGALTC